MARAFASQADMAEKKITFSRLSEHAYAFTAEGDPNTGVVVGDDAVMVIDTQATPKMAQAVIQRIRSVTDKPIRYVVLSNYHALRVLGATAYEPQHVICSEATRDTIVWLPEERALFSGDLVESGATPYAGDAHYKDWPQTLQKLRDLRPLALVPGRGDALVGEEAVEQGNAGTQAFLADLYKTVSA